MKTALIAISLVILGSCIDKPEPKTLIISSTDLEIHRFRANDHWKSTNLTPVVADNTEPGLVDVAAAVESLVNLGTPIQPVMRKGNGRTDIDVNHDFLSCSTSSLWSWRLSLRDIEAECCYFPDNAASRVCSGVVCDFPSSSECGSLKNCETSGDSCTDDCSVNEGCIQNLCQTSGDECETSCAEGESCLQNFCSIVDAHIFDTDARLNLCRLEQINDPIISQNALCNALAATIGLFGINPEADSCMNGCSDPASEFYPCTDGTGGTPDETTLSSHDVAELNSLYGHSDTGGSGCTPNCPTVSCGTEDDGCGGTCSADHCTSGAVDCDETGIDCGGTNCSACGACSPAGASCVNDIDCCSNKCKGMPGNKTCK